MSVKMKSPAGAVGAVPDGAVDHWKGKGWTPVDDETPLSVDVEPTPPAELKGDALDDAVKKANELGAGIDANSKADEKRAALAEWQNEQNQQ